MAVTPRQHRSLLLLLRLLLLLLVGHHSVRPVDASGLLEIRWRRVARGDDQPVDSREQSAPASGSTTARLCLKAFSSPLSTDCSYGLLNETVREQNGSSDDALVRYGFSYAWPSRVYYLMELARDHTASDVRQVDRLAGEAKLRPNQNWTTVGTHGSFHDDELEIALEMRVTCSPNYYGPGCTTFCRESSSYVCRDRDGARLCRNGWSGSHCETPLCPSGCANNGTCTAPHTCQCAEGFSGDRCQVCRPLKGCRRGSCADNRPDTCLCEAGWGGFYCDQVLDVCQAETPCRNDAICRPTAPGRYACICQLGWRGLNCERAAPQESTTTTTVSSGEQATTNNCPLCLSGARCEVVDERCLRDLNWMKPNGGSNTNQQHKRHADPTAFFTAATIFVLVLLVVSLLALLLGLNWHWRTRRMRMNTSRVHDLSRAERRHSTIGDGGGQPQKTNNEDEEEEVVEGDKLRRRPISPPPQYDEQAPPQWSPVASQIWTSSSSAEAAMSSAKRTGAGKEPIFAIS